MSENEDNIKNTLRLEWHASVAAGYTGSYYQFLLSRGFNRFQLSRYGVSNNQVTKRMSMYTPFRRLKQ